jgi:23S rRNA (cytosine1962-C5)-methyltransferase
MRSSAAMSAREGYALVDAGEGRRLERFGDRLVDRPAPGAVEARRDERAWAAADMRYDRIRGWSGDSSRLAPWSVALDGLTLELRPTEAGQVGVFPEHAAMWPWLDRRIRERRGGHVLNLFGYTGATTLALARAGAHVAHVDASRPAIAWARRNAELSSLAAAPIRWLIDDAQRFAEREVRRERRYAGFVIDPPAFGHGAAGRWRLDDDLARLLRACGRLADTSAFLLLTAHSVGWGDDRLVDAVAGALDVTDLDAGPLDVTAERGASIRLGAFVRGIIAP